jgi:erythromycin esterase-like protein
MQSSYENKLKYLILFILLSKLSFTQEITGIFTKDSINSIYNSVINSISPDVLILGLGEQYHGDGETFSIKSDLMQLLGKKKNAVCFFESSAFGCQKGAESGLYNDTLNMGINSIWSRTKEFQPLIKSLQKKEIEYAGIDVQIYDNYANYYLSDFIKNSLDSLKILSKKQLINLLNTTDSLIKHRYKYHFSNSQFFEWVTIFNIIANNKHRFNLKDYYIILNLKNYGMLVNKYANSQNNFSMANRFRDSLMSLNCVYLIENLYKNRLIVLSAASFHLTKKHNIDYPASDKNVKTLGDFLAEKYSNKYSTIIFTSASGFHALYNEVKLEKVPKPKNNSIEKMLYNRQFEYAFVNFNKDTSFPFMYYMPEGYEYVKITNPKIHFDSIFYVKQMQRAQSNISSKKN